MSKPLWELGTGSPPALLAPTRPRGATPKPVCDIQPPASVCPGHLGSCAGQGSVSWRACVSGSGVSRLGLWENKSLPPPRTPETRPHLPLQAAPRASAGRMTGRRQRPPWAQRPVPTRQGSWVSSLADVTRPKSSAAVPCQQGGSEGHSGTAGSSSARTAAIYQEISSGQRQSGRKKLSAGDNPGSLGGHRAQEGSCPHPGPPQAPGTPPPRGWGALPWIWLRAPAQAALIGTSGMSGLNPMTPITRPQVNPRGTQAPPPEAMSAWLPPGPAASPGQPPPEKPLP